MAATVLMPQDHISLPHYSEEKGYDDHLFENHILDIDEPTYANSDAFMVTDDDSNRPSDVDCIVQPAAKNSLTIYVGHSNEIVNNKLNSTERENIYENAAFIQNCLESQKINFFIPSSDNDEKEERVGHYKSTLSLVIGKPGSELKMVKCPEFNESSSGTPGSDANIVSCPEFPEIPSGNPSSKLKIVNSPKVPEPSITDDNLILDLSDDGSFKSSYAKSLMDSFTQNSCKQLSPPVNITRKFTYLPDYKDAVTVSGGVSNFPILSEAEVLSFSDKSERQLEKRIQTLSDNLSLKTKEVDKLKQELLILKLECNRIKSENKSLKMARSMNYRHSPNYLNMDSQMSSLSNESDTWTLQQQLFSLNSQLERAELSKHAYESATKQLIQFLQTINSTLVAVSGPETDPPSLLCNSVPNIGESLETFHCGKSDILPNGEIPSEKLKCLRCNGVLSAQVLEGNKSVDEGHRTSKTKSTKVRQSEQAAIQTEGKMIPSKKRRSKHGSKRSKALPQQWSDSGKRDLVRSESVNNIPKQERTPATKVSRAVSVHCVSFGEVNMNQSGWKMDGKSVPSQISTNQLLSAKAKGFFSSVKNLFLRNENCKSVAETCCPESNSTTKITRSVRHFAMKHKRDSAANQVSLPNHASDGDATYERNLDNSVFYLPFDQSSEGESVLTLVANDSPKSSIVDSHPITSGAREQNSFGGACDDEELSGPQEISVALSVTGDTTSTCTYNLPPSVPGDGSIHEGGMALNVGDGHFVYDNSFNSRVDSSSQGVYGSNSDTYPLDAVNILRTDDWYSPYIINNYQDSTSVINCTNSYTDVNLRKERPKFNSRSLSYGGGDLPRPDLDLGLREYLWKLSRSSFRHRRCRLEFV